MQLLYFHRKKKKIKIINLKHKKKGLKQKNGRTRFKRANSNILGKKNTNFINNSNFYSFRNNLYCWICKTKISIKNKSFISNKFIKPI